MKQSKLRILFDKTGDPMVLIFYMLLIAVLLTYIVPAGEYVSTPIDGRTVLDPNSYHTIEQSPVSIFDIFTSIYRGLVNSGIYAFMTFITGGLFYMFSLTGTMNNVIGALVNKVGVRNKNFLIFACIYFFGMQGIATGYEANIALVPLSVMIATSIGYSKVVGACISIGGIGIGFALSPINPYTVGTAHMIAELPIFSGALLRTILVFIALTILALYIIVFIAPKHPATEEERMGSDFTSYKVSTQDWIVLITFILGIVCIASGSYLASAKILNRSWYINEISAIFIIISIITAIVFRYTPNQYVEYMMKGASKVIAGALVIGVAASIRVVLEDGKIIHSIVFYLSQMLNDVPNVLSAILATVIQGILNLFIPSGSGQALATMPILIPVADLIGLSRQLMVLSFQVGDGLTNLIIPTSGGTLAMLAMARVSYVKWVGVIFPLISIIYILSWIFIVIGYYIGWS